MLKKTLSFLSIALLAVAFTAGAQTAPAKKAADGTWTDAKAAGDWTVVTRDDGSKQWAYKGKPLYTWAKDTKPGDKTGDGVNGTWKTAKP